MFTLKKWWKYLLIVGTISGIVFMGQGHLYLSGSSSEGIKLPPPSKAGKPLEECIFYRTSIREFRPDALILKEVGQLLWSGGGISIDGLAGPTRAIPSAGATYPLEFYLVAGNVKGLAPGVYHYQYRDHQLLLVKKGDVRRDLGRAALGQIWIEQAPISIVIAALYSRTTMRYGDRGNRYVLIEVGHAGQNISLQVQSLGLATVPIAAFYDDAVKKTLGIEADPLYIFPIGKKYD